MATQNAMRTQLFLITSKTFKLMLLNWIQIRTKEITFILRRIHTLTLAVKILNDFFFLGALRNSASAFTAEGVLPLVVNIMVVVAFGDTNRADPG